jgi:hypothetical protein
VTQLLTETDTDGYNPAVRSDIAEMSAIGHVDTAKIVSTILNDVWSDGLKCDIPVARKSIKCGRYDTLIVAQYSGPRLPEGATTLPEGACINFYVVEFIEKVFYQRAKDALAAQIEKTCESDTSFDLGFAGCQTE